jgi:hypothetical protein
MSTSQSVQCETIARVANELVGTPIDRQRLDAVAALVGALMSEMSRMRAMNVGGDEPATIYTARVQD